MRDDGPFALLVEEVEFQLAQRRHWRARGAHFIVTHLNHAPGTLCGPGETIGDIAAVTSPEPVSLGLAHMASLIFDCLCRYHLPLSAGHIEEIMNTDPFYLYYGANRIEPDQLFSRPDRHTVRIYVERIRRQMETIFRRAHIGVDPNQILISEKTDSNIFVYRLRATCEFVHLANRSLTYNGVRRT